MKKKVVRLTENQIKQIINKSVTEILMESGRYSGEYDRTGNPVNDNDYIESVEYVIDSITNGNIEQAKQLITNMSINDIGELGQIVKIHTHYYVREDNISLYGFLTREELKMFELLLSVSGVGAKSAITMLSNVSTSLYLFLNGVSKSAFSNSTIASRILCLWLAFIP